MGIDSLVACVVTALSMAVLRDSLGWDGAFFVNHPSAGFGVFGFAVVQIGFWLVCIRWFFGHLSPLPKNEQLINEPHTWAGDVPP